MDFEKVNLLEETYENSLQTEESSAVENNGESSLLSFQPSSVHFGYEFCCDPVQKLIDDEKKFEKKRDQHRRLMIKDPDHRFIDTHCHLDWIFTRFKFEKDFKTFKKNHSLSWSPNFAGCITDFCFPEYYLKDNSDFWDTILSNKDVWAAVGCHPHQAHLYDLEVEKYIKERSSNEKVVAIGELGLDYSPNNKVEHELQMKVLEQQLELGVRTGKPLVLHCRKADEDCLRIFKSKVPRDYPIHWHCFMYNSKIAETWSNYFSRLHFGVTLNVFWGKKDQRLFFQNISLNRLLIETDSPYFMPSHYSTEEFGSLEYTHPGLAGLVAIKLAEIKKEDVAYVSEKIFENTKKLYNLNA